MTRLHGLALWFVPADRAYLRRVAYVLAPRAARGYQTGALWLPVGRALSRIFLEART